jgi:uncharacterized protein YmfQ (DUF2313 family)
VAKSDRYRDLLIRLMPKGKLWQFNVGTTVYNLLDGMAIELSRVDDRAEKLLREQDPARTVELLPEWEKEYGLPDECSPLAPTLQQRRVNLLAKFLAQGGQSEQYFIDLFAGQQVDIEIDQGEPSYVPMSIPAEITGEAPKYIFTVTIPDFQVQYLEAEGSAEDYLGTILGSSNVACIIEKYKPAHTTAVYNYGT